MSWEEVNVNFPAILTWRPGVTILPLSLLLLVAPIVPVWMIRIFNLPLEIITYDSNNYLLNLTIMCVISNTCNNVSSALFQYVHELVRVIRLRLERITGYRVSFIINYLMWVMIFSSQCLLESNLHFYIVEPVVLTYCTFPQLKRHVRKNNYIYKFWSRPVNDPRNLPSHQPSHLKAHNAHCARNRPDSASPYFASFTWNKDPKHRVPVLENSQMT